MKIRSLFCILLFLFSINGYGQNCTLSVSISESEPTICSGNSITLTANATQGTPAYSYVWSTGDSTAFIAVNKPGSYSVTVTDHTSGCAPVKQSINVTSTISPNPPIVKGQVACPNTSVTLTATPQDPNDQWYSSNGTLLFTGASFTTPNINSPTTFYVQTTAGGCTSNRTSVSVNLATKPQVTGDTICVNNQATLKASGGDTYAWYPTSAGTGTPLSTSANFTTPVLNASQTYYVVVSTNGCTSLPTAVTATVTAGPQPPSVDMAPAVCAGNSVNLHATAPSGTFNWYNVPTGGTPLISSPDYTTPALNANTTYYVENVINDCVSTRTSLTVTVTQPPPTPNPQTQTICYQSKAVLTGGTNNALTYNWYDAQTGGNLLYSGITFTTPVLIQSTVYYLELINGGCGSSRSAITVNVSQMVDAPAATGVIICPGAMATLTATAAGGTYQWYDAATGGNLISSTNTYTTPALMASSTYYVQNTVNGCTGPRAAVTVTVLAAPAPPAVTNSSVCYNSPAVLSATSPSDNYGWYASATGGTAVSTAQVYVTPNLMATTTYYVETSNANGCTSTRAPLTVTVNAETPAPTASGTSPICSGNMALLTASGPAGQFQWYDLASGGNLLATGSNFTTPKLTANTTYYVQDVIAGCPGPRTAVTINVTPQIDPQFQYPTGTACSTSKNVVPVINNPAGGTFSATPAGLSINITTGVINTAASAPGIYEISFSGNGTCPHTSTSRFGINTTDADFTYNGPFCQDGTDPLPVFAADASAGIFTASPAGLVFKNPTTGEIDLANSKAGSYKVTNSIAATGSCVAASAFTTVVISQRVNVYAGPPQTVQQGSLVQLAGVVTGGATGGTWSGGTGMFSNPSLLNAVYAPGLGETVAHLTLTSNDPTLPCGPHLDVVTITFKPLPESPVVQGTSLCDGTNTTLSATAPGGYYQWFATATATQELASGPTFTTLWLTQTTTYYVQTTYKGLVSARTAVTVTVNPVPVAPVVKSSAPETCAGSTATLSASGSAAGSIYEWYDAAAGGNLVFTGNTFVTSPLQLNTKYYVQARETNCTSPRTEVDVPVSATPYITSAGANVICTGTPLNYTIQSNLVNATYMWSRAAVDSISNPAAQSTSNTITETLNNISSSAINVTYVITPMNGSCAGTAFNYVVTVNPQPVVKGPAAASICNGTTDNYAILFNTPVTKYTWSRAAVTGVKNAAVSGQESPIIREVLFNTTTAPVVVPYVISYQTTTCSGNFTLNITVNPTDSITSAKTGTVCSGTSQNYVITANIPGTTFIWSRAAVTGISNSPVTGSTANTISESLDNTNTGNVNVTYIITPQANGCDGLPFTYTVTVYALPVTPNANVNSPICVGSAIQLFVTQANNTTYVWTAPNGTTYSTPNVTIDNATAADAGTYTLVATNIHGCSGPAVTYTVAVDALGVAHAGPKQTVCATVASIALTGSITGGPANPIWSSAGTGTFSSNTSLITQYIPSQADTAAGFVVLSLEAVSPGGCSSNSSVKITFGQEPGVDAGPHQDVCSQETAVPLAGKILLPLNVMWSSSGTGNFTPSADQAVTTYIPSAADEKNGSVLLTLNVINGGPCIIQSDTMSISFIGPPTLSLPSEIPILKGYQLTLNPVVNESNLTYLWSPDVDISNVHIKNPVITGDIDRTYTLTVTDSRGCQTTDTTFEKVSPPIIVPNTFTPNGDGHNDKWELQGLQAYTEAVVDIFNRYGAKIYHSIGYSNPWDGTYNNKPVPSGEYYYIIDTKFEGLVRSGNINLVR